MQNCTRLPKFFLGQDARFLDACRNVKTTANASLKMKINKPLIPALMCSALLLFKGAFAQDEDEEAILDLEEFITTEVAQELSDSLIQSDRPVSSAFFADMELLDIPRAVLVLAPEAMEQFQIDNFDDLQKVGAGTERYNFYGIPGAPVMRGWQGGIYFNGMLRLFQRNEMPTSFGALEAMEVMKGPAPAQFVPSHVGGYVNMIPKSPFFDESRGSFKIELGSNSLYNFQIDKGGPFLAGSKPAAYRLSLSAHQADTFWKRVSNDFVSLYGSIKMRLSENTFLSAGAEYYEFRSNENAGWNRPTQNLIDNREYVIGEPLSLVRAGSGGLADRGLLDGILWGSAPLTSKNYADFRALVVPANLVESAVSKGHITDAQMATLKNMADPEVRAATYAGMPDDVSQTTTGYLYTPEYFLAGGSVFTRKIEASDVLADSADFADSEDLMAFFDIDHRISDNFTLENKIFFEQIKTDKISSYQYAFRSEQTSFDDRLSLTNDFDLGNGMSLTLNYGVQARFLNSIQLQDFWSEPFARRDITLPNISNNTVFLSGAQVDPLTNNNYWGGGFGAGGPGAHAVNSKLQQLGAFASALFDLGKAFSIIASVRYDTLDFDISVPDGPTDITPNSTSGDESFFNYCINPSIRVNESMAVYAAYQIATTYSPAQGGAILGVQNFGDSSLKEAGVKFSMMDGRLYAAFAIYEWAQAAFNDRTASSDPYESEGIEFELNFAATDKTTIIASYSDRETRRTSGLGYRSMPFGLIDPTGAGDDEIGLALGAGTLLNQFANALGGFTPEGRTPTANPDRIVPGAPESAFKFFVKTDFSDRWGLAAGVVHSSAYWHSYDRNLRADAATVVNVNIMYRAKRWDAMLSLENLTGEDYYIGADPNFAANTLITKEADTVQGRLTIKVPF